VSVPFESPPFLYTRSDRRSSGAPPKRRKERSLTLRRGNANLGPLSPLCCVPISAVMESAQVVALAILGSYFGVIIGLFTIILRSIPATKERQQQRNAFKLLTVLSFAHTWYCSSYYDSRPNKRTNAGNRYV
jgi:hypothetical protein